MLVKQFYKNKIKFFNLQCFIIESDYVRRHKL